jgi:hypothetical protein
MDSLRSPLPPRTVPLLTPNLHAFHFSSPMQGITLDTLLPMLPSLGAVISDRVSHGCLFKRPS